VVMVERDPRSYAGLQANREVLEAAQVELVRGDALEFLRTERRQHDVIFLDPPFKADYSKRLRALLPPRMTPDSRVYYESGARINWPDGWEVLKHGRAGQVYFDLVKLT
jgi:16S rRNA (guanine966-N2)-methyltransferase